MDIGGGNFVPLRVREERLPASRRIKRGFLLLAVMLWAFRRGWCCQGRHFCYFFDFWWMKPLQKRPIILKIQDYSPNLSFGSFWPKIQSRPHSFSPPSDETKETTTARRQHWTWTMEGDTMNCLFLPFVSHHKRVSLL